MPTRAGRPRTPAAAATPGLPALGALLAFGAALIWANDAMAEPFATTAGEFNTPYGESYGQESQPFDPRTRDSAGNRTIISGRILLGEESSTLPPSLAASYASSSASASASGGFGGFGGATAIGNQLNVIVQGDWNTVVVDATQTNNGDVTAIVGGAGEEDDEQ